MQSVANAEQAQPVATVHSPGEINGSREVAYLQGTCADRVSSLEVVLRQGNNALSRPTACNSGNWQQGFYQRSTEDHPFAWQDGEATVVLRAYDNGDNFIDGYETTVQLKSG
ncbi:hypothetical protein APR12_005092 [Nocardia amikacinitolerans]|nr:hypothetical protein [Nocardia amikacinitolerans]